MEVKHKNEEARKAKRAKKGGNDQFGAPFGRHWPKKKHKVLMMPKA